MIGLSKRILLAVVVAVLVVVCTIQVPYVIHETRLLSPFNLTTIDVTQAPTSPAHVVTAGENIRAGNREVYITTAVQYNDVPSNGSISFFLNGWAKYKSNMKFKCCLLTDHTTTGKSSGAMMLQANALVFNIYSQWIVDMQSAEFVCRFSPRDVKKLNITSVDRITFASNSCEEAPLVRMAVLHPEPHSKEVGICLKVTYGTVNASRMIEWFEYVKLMGVTKVMTFYYDVDDDVMRVLRHYEKQGLVDTRLIHPAHSESGPERGFRRPRNEPQAFTDEVMGANDCKHRMAGFKYVITMDLDEFILPMGKQKSYFDILEAALKREPEAGTFRFDAYVMMLDWKATRSSPLHIGQFVRRISYRNYDHWGRQARWGYIPSRTFYVKNNYAYPKKNFKAIVVYHDLYRLFHFRSCKVGKWKNCNKTKKVEDTAMLEYENDVIKGIQQQNIDALLTEDKYSNYRHNIRKYRPKKK